MYKTIALILLLFAFTGCMHFQQGVPSKDVSLLSQESMIGIWDASPFMGSGFTAHYQFFPSGTFYFGVSQPFDPEREDSTPSPSYAGNWKVERMNHLILTIREQNGIVLTTPTVTDITLGACTSIDSTPDDKSCRTFLYNGDASTQQNFYQYSNDPLAYGDELVREPVFFSK